MRRQVLLPYKTNWISWIVNLTVSFYWSVMKKMFSWRKNSRKSIMKYFLWSKRQSILSSKIYETETEWPKCGRLWNCFQQRIWKYRIFRCSGLPAYWANNCFIKDGDSNTVCGWIWGWAASAIMEYRGRYDFSIENGVKYIVGFR